MSSIDSSELVEASPRPRTLSATKVVPAALTIPFIALLTFVALYQLRPPAAKGVNAAAPEFSAGRALEHVKAIALKPRPPGTAEHVSAREYIVGQLKQFGLDAEVQEADKVANVIGRLKGTGGGTGAILLMSHYDTVPTSPGAADDGSGVAAVLETLRALKAGPPLRNDVVALFSDGEETGLLGAKAFAESYPGRDDVKVVLNFDARGDIGPVLMFETSPQNGWLIEHFADAAPKPVANSLMFEVYKRLPNDTDFTVFKRKGVAGLNFAPIGGFATYHNKLDTLADFSVDTLQHVGENALPLARAFGNLSLERTREPDAVYFDLLGATLITYPGWLVLPLAIVAGLAFAAVVFYGVRKGRLRPGRVGLGFLALLLSVIAAAAVNYAAASYIGLRHPRSWLAIQPDTPQGRFYALGLLALTVAVVTAIYAWFRARVGVGDLLVGAALWWLLLTWLTALFLPGASYLFTWPLLFALLAAALVLSAEGGEITQKWMIAALLLCAAPGVLLLVPLAYLVLVGLTLTMAAAVMTLVVLLLGLLVPPLGPGVGRRRWVLPAVAAICGTALFIIAG